VLLVGTGKPHEFFKMRRIAFIVALVAGLFPYLENSANAVTFDLLPGNTVELEIMGDFSMPGSITITESMQPTIVELLATPGITSFSGFIDYTEVSQSGSVNTGFFNPQACAAPGDCGPFGGVFECICGIDFPEGTIAARDGYPVTISVTDTSRYFQFVDYFSTVGLVTSVGILPFDLKLTVDASDGLGINVISGLTPLPSALPLFATGLGALGLLGWRRKRKNAAALAAA